MRKGQASMEYMSTYVYAGIALVVVVGAMGYFGAFDSASYTKETCESGDQLSCNEASISAEGNIDIMITNNFDRAITILNYTIVYDNKEFPVPNVNYVLPKNKNYSLSLPVLTSDLKFSEGKKEELSYYLYYQPDQSTQIFVLRGKATSKVKEKLEFFCGNNILEGREECDPPGSKVKNYDCKRFLLGNDITTSQTDYFDPETQEIQGTIRCDNNCQMNTTTCKIVDKCGNGIINEHEQCDPKAPKWIDGFSCANIDGDTYSSGTAVCTDNCFIDKSDCDNDQSCDSDSECGRNEVCVENSCINSCGNEIHDSNEQCEYTIFTTGLCANIDNFYDEGYVTCNDDCTFNVSQCESSSTTNDCVAVTTTWEQDEVKTEEACCQNQEEYCAFNNICYPDGHAILIDSEESLACDAQSSKWFKCKVSADDTTSDYNCNNPTPVAECGNDILEFGEKCDPTSLDVEKQCLGTCYSDCSCELVDETCPDDYCEYDGACKEPGSEVYMNNVDGNTKKFYCHEGNNGLWSPLSTVTSTTITN